MYLREDSIQGYTIDSVVFIVLEMYNFVFPLAPSITKIEFVQKIVMDTKEETTAQATH